MKNLNKINISITLDSNIISWIDKERNNINRSLFINKILTEKFLEFKKQFDWELEDKNAEDDIKNNNVKEFSKVNEAKKWLKS